jgi:hypothetical protein
MLNADAQLCEPYAVYSTGPWILDGNVTRAYVTLKARAAMLRVRKQVLDHHSIFGGYSC